MNHSLTRIASVIGVLGNVESRFVDAGIGHNYDEEYYETMGDDLMGDFATVGYVGAMPNLRAAPHAFAKAGPRPVALGRPGVPRPAILPPKPGWRGMVAPGVASPGEGMQPLPMTPSLNNGVFTSAITSMVFTARPQVPFRAERVIASVRRAGAAGVTILCTTFFIGRQLQLVQNGSFDIEFYSPTAFGVRLALDSAEPGMDITMNMSTSVAPTGTDTLSVSILLHGRSIR